MSLSAFSYGFKGPQLVDDSQCTFRYYDDGKWFLPVCGRFEIVDYGCLVIYRQKGFYKTADHDFYYFSETIDSPIYPLKFKQLRRLMSNEQTIALLKTIRHDLTKVVDGHTQVNAVLERLAFR